MLQILIAVAIYAVLATIAAIALSVYLSRYIDDLNELSDEFQREHELRIKAEGQYHSVSEKYNELATTHAKTLNAVKVLENEKAELEKELNKFPFRDEKGRYCKRTV